MKWSVVLDGLRLVLAAAPEVVLGEMLNLFAAELESRLKRDARNYVRKAVACLDAERIAAHADPATSEPTPSA